ncbi:MAG: histidinol-phosphate transaminase [Candidatus Gastranaerophilales bacterium]|nr:histidinol-phosphate transaminase [Candidatus Gastranaerophilales bacterium]
MTEPKLSVKNTKPYDVPLFEEEYSLKIDANENLFGASDKVIEALHKITKEQLLKYPVYGSLTQKLADFYGVSIDNIKVTNGADEALFSLMNAYLENGDAMLTVTPSFSMPKLYAQISGGEVIEIPYKKRWVFPINEFLKQIKNNQKIKIVHLTSPNNPTGDCLNEELADKIIKAAKDKLVIFDETYAGYCDFSMISKVKKYDNIAVVKSFSKDFALAGLRIGYIITHPDRVKLLKTVISPYSVNTIAATLAEAALSDTEHFKKVRKAVKKSVEYLTKELKNTGFTVYPSEANFVLIDAKEKADFVFNTLLKNGIKVRKFSAPDMQGLIRITAPDLKNCKKIISLLQPKKTLIFDMDGVLVDVSNSYRTTIKKTYEYFAKGKTVTYDDISQAKSLGGLNNDWDLTEYLLKKDGFKVSKKKIIEVFEKIYFDNGKGLISKEKFLFDKKLIKKLSEKYNLAIFTGRPRTEALFTLQKENVERYFYPIITMDDLPKDKQKPDILGIEKIKKSVSSTNIYYFGDTKDDMLCGIKANVIAVGILPPQNQTDEYKKLLKQSGAKKVLKSINKLEQITERK